MPIDPFTLARQLIDIPSPTDHEYAVAEHLDHLLTRLGFATKRHGVSPSRFNLSASA
jgi:acetylornithine deacetylase/succinyl-diaminopimelate desuccinylase-like protein